MKSSSRLAIQVCVISLMVTLLLLGIPGTAMAQEKEPQKPKPGSEQPLKDIRKAETASPQRLSSPGEPVPGAEVYIEQGNEKRKGVTNSDGDVVFKNLKKGDYKATVVISEKYLKQKGQSLKGKTDPLGTYHFGATISSGKNTKSYEFEIEAGKVFGQPRSMMTGNGGPYSQSVSNIEDNIVVHVALTRVNNEGIR